MRCMQGNGGEEGGGEKKKKLAGRVTTRDRSSALFLLSSSIQVLHPAFINASILRLRFLSAAGVA